MLNLFISSPYWISARPNALLITTIVAGAWVCTSAPRLSKVAAREDAATPPFDVVHRVFYASSRRDWHALHSVVLSQMMGGRSHDEPNLSTAYQYSHALDAFN